MVRSSYYFEASGIRQRWQRQNIATSVSISEISFRAVNLYTAVDRGSIADSQATQDLALEIEADLETWAASVPQRWRFTAKDVSDAAMDVFFKGKTHVYPGCWIADGWNKWRMLRILVNQILVRTEADLEQPGHIARAAIARIRQLSADICISVASFMGSPRKSSRRSDCFYGTKDLP